MFGKLFGSKKVPSNEGTSDGTGTGLKVLKVYELELANMEGTPSYVLTHQLTIGSEIGNIVISDPSVSPRHATFILQQDVVSVMDHGSVAGTLVNGKKIPGGRYIILEESDSIHVGDLEVRLRSKNEGLTISEEGSEEPGPEEAQAPASDSADTEEESEDLPEDMTPAPSKTSKLFAFFKRKKQVEEAEEAEEPEEPIQTMPEEDKTPQPSRWTKLKSKFVRKKAPVRGKAKLEMGLTTLYSANALVRVMAVLMDFILAYALVVILWPFDEVRQFVAFIPAEAEALSGLEWSAVWSALVEDYGFLTQAVEDIYGLFSTFIPLGPLLLFFLLIRLVSTLILGVSISEYLLFIRSSGNRIWARIGGILRVLIGAVTGPLIVFDVPAVVSRRTLKEFITFTRIQLSSKILSIISGVIFLPLFITIALIAPLLEGFEPPLAIDISERIEQRVKAKNAPAEATAEPEVAPVIMVSRFFHLELPVKDAEVSLIPAVKFQGKKKKVSYSTQLFFFERELQRPVSLELLKNFDMQKLLTIAMKGNFLLHDRFPRITAYVNQADAAAPFKPSADALAQTEFANEFISLAKLALGLSLENASEFMQTETPFIKGLIDFRSSLLALLEYKDFDQISFIKLGNVVFMKVNYPGQKPFDLIVPLVMAQGHLFRVEYDKKENLSAISSKFYKYVLEKANWLSIAQPETRETLDALQVLDLLANLEESDKKISSEKAQALYGHYFERSAEILKRGEGAEYELWKRSLQTIVKLIENLQATSPKAPEGEEDPIAKLHQNFNDLMDAITNKNLDYFGASETTTI